MTSFKFYIDLHNQNPKRFGLGVMNLTVAWDLARREVGRVRRWFMIWSLRKRRCDSSLSFRERSLSYGFTLFEALIAMGIFALATFAIFTFIQQGYQIQQFSFESEQIISSAQRGVDSLVREARELLPSAAGAYPVERADANEFIFFADYDRDNFVERVRYFISGTDFKKGVIEPTGNPITYPSASEVVSVISRGVRNTETGVALFQYYNGDWPGDSVQNPLAVPANPTQVKLVRIDLRVNILPNKAPKEFQLVSEVSIRNLKENL